MAAVFDLNHPAHVVHWHFILISVPNIVVIAAMLVVFVLALLLPFPGAARRRAAREAGVAPPRSDGPGVSGEGAL